MRRGHLARLAILILLTASTAGCRSKSDTPAPENEAAEEEGARVLTIYRTDEAGIATDCGAVMSEQWAVPDPAPADLPTAAIREVIRDVGPSRRLHEPDTKPLIEYFREVKVRDGTAILAFDEGALEYLNNAACAQAAVKSPMVRTLLEFPGVSRVEFEIEGEIFRDWDA